MGKHTKLTIKKVERVTDRQTDTAIVYNEYNLQKKA